jgi:hypothetical protein
MKDQGNWRSGGTSPGGRRAGQSVGAPRIPALVAAAGRGPFVIAVLLVALALLVAAAPAHAGAAFGVRGGYAKVDADAFRGSGKIGEAPFFGLQAVLPIVPLVSLVIAGEQRTKEFDFGNASFGGLHLQGRAKWTEQALYASARIRSPGVVGIYGGVGAGLHRQQTDLSGVVEVATTKRLAAGRARGVAAADPVGDFIRGAQKELTDPSWHAIVGVEISAPVVPLAIFAEGRIDDIQGSAPAAGAVYAGVNLQLP